MDANALVIQMLLDRQRDIEELRARVAELEAAAAVDRKDP